MTAKPTHVVSLVSIEDDARDEQLRVVWELERGAVAYDEHGLPDPAGGFDDPSHLDAFLDAVRWGRLAPNRLAQGAFRAVVLTAYHDRCAITGTRIRPVLQAAHIRPVGKAGENRIDNGLSLRSDVHTMFDNGYLSVSPDHKLLVSPRLRTDFGNGKQFYDMAGEEIAVLPDRKTDRPNPDFLQWHADEVYKAS